ncbi:hypothetical protein H4Q26_010942 [Puccinia striiformis f. sp. tritici PST-130]|nr:hypothetical protein H4Q26_010942 [Puccinia striiformis f. sp. tritici PST-130]
MVFNICIFFKSIAVLGLLVSHAAATRIPGRDITGRSPPDTNGYGTTGGNIGATLGATLTSPKRSPGAHLRTSTATAQAGATLGATLTSPKRSPGAHLRTSTATAQAGQHWEQP